MEKIYGVLNRYFKLEQHGTDIKKEFIAAATNYFTIIYILLLVPEILISAFPGAINLNGDIVYASRVFQNMRADQVLAAITAVGFITAGIATMVMGLIINVPFVQGPSIAITTFAAYTVCGTMGYSYGEMLAMVFLSGVCFFILSITGIEKRISKAIPKNLKYAVTGGIGLFIAFSGLRKAHIIEYDADMVFTLFNASAFNSDNTLSAWLALFGVVIIAVMLKKHVHGAVFIGKLICIALAVPLGLVSIPQSNVWDIGIHVDRLFFNMDFAGLFDLSGGRAFIFSVASVVVVVFALCIMDVFETVSVLIATDTFTDINKGEAPIKKRIPQMLEIDAATTCLGSAMGAASVSTYAESTTGIIEGGRTGLTSVFTGIMFLLSTVFSPLMSAIPSAATATTLIAAGVLMLGVIKYIDFDNIAEAVPAFMIMFLMPFTGSILSGVAVGIAMYVIIHLLIGEAKKTDALLYILTAFFVIAVWFTAM